MRSLYLYSSSGHSSMSGEFPCVMVTQLNRSPGNEKHMMRSRNYALQIITERLSLVKGTEWSQVQQHSRVPGQRLCASLQLWGERLLLLLLSHVSSASHQMGSSSPPSSTTSTSTVAPATEGSNFHVLMLKLIINNESIPALFFNAQFYWYLLIPLFNLMLSNGFRQVTNTIICIY